MLKEVFSIPGMNGKLKVGLNVQRSVEEDYKN